MIRHTNEILVYLNTDSGVYAFGSTKVLNDLFDGSNHDSSELSPTIKLQQIDDNEDGLNEHLRLKISFQTNGA